MGRLDIQGFWTVNRCYAILLKGALLRTSTASSGGDSLKEVKEAGPSNPSSVSGRGSVWWKDSEPSLLLFRSNKDSRPRDVLTKLRDCAYFVSLNDGASAPPPSRPQSHMKMD